MKLKAYEVTAAGFYGGCDETDDRVIWVLAPDEATVKNAILFLGAKFWGEMVDHIALDEETFRIEGGDFVLPRENGAFSERLLHFQNRPPVFSAETLFEMARLANGA